MIKDNCIATYISTLSQVTYTQAVCGLLQKQLEPLHIFLILKYLFYHVHLILIKGNDLFLQLRKKNSIAYKKYISALNYRFSLANSHFGRKKWKKLHAALSPTPFGASPTSITLLKRVSSTLLTVISNVKLETRSSMILQGVFLVA